MDHRAVDQAERINSHNSPVLQYCGGSVSPEMQAPKVFYASPIIFSRNLIIFYAYVWGFNLVFATFFIFNTSDWIITMGYWKPLSMYLYFISQLKSISLKKNYHLSSLLHPRNFGGLFLGSINMNCIEAGLLSSESVDTDFLDLNNYQIDGRLTANGSYNVVAFSLWNYTLCPNTVLYGDRSNGYVSGLI